MVSVRTVTLFFRMDTPDDWVEGRDHSYLEEGEELVVQRFMRSMRFFSEMLCSTMKKRKHTNDYACRSRPVLASGLVSATSREPIWQQGLRKGENPRENGDLTISSDMGAEASNESGGFGEKEQGPERSISEKGKLRNEARGTRLRCIVLLVFVTHSIGIRWGVYI